MILSDEALPETARKTVEDTIKRLNMINTKEILSKSRVVGTTCLSSTLEVFRSQSFDIVILDEASQVTEPMALLPILQFRCTKVVLVGDPLQVIIHSNYSML